MAPRPLSALLGHLRSLVVTPQRARRPDERGGRSERITLGLHGVRSLAGRFAGAGRFLLRRPPRSVLLTLGAALALLLVLGGTGAVLSATAENPPLLAAPESSKGSAEASAKRFASKLESLRPRGIHIVVDTALNRLYLREGSKVLREAIVSCGSGGVLANPKGGKDWVFDTPRGERTVVRKVKNPLWIKPDWAFVEEGKAIPPKNAADRAEEGVLGDYALGIGDGYFLHGTLYTRMLGRNVTHGCVRIGDADLSELYKRVPVGAKVYLF